MLKQAFSMKIWHKFFSFSGLLILIVFANEEPEVSIFWLIWLFIRQFVHCEFFSHNFTFPVFETTTEPSVDRLRLSQCVKVIWLPIVHFEFQLCNWSVWFWIILNTLYTSMVSETVPPEQWIVAMEGISAFNTGFEKWGYWKSVSPSRQIEPMVNIGPCWSLKNCQHPFIIIISYITAVCV